MYGLNLPAVHLHQFSKYCEKTGRQISSGRRIPVTISRQSGRVCPAILVALNS
jgi:hypothetical protein